MISANYLFIQMPEGVGEWVIFIIFATMFFFLPVWIVYWIVKYFVNKGNVNKRQHGN